MANQNATLSVDIKVNGSENVTKSVNAMKELRNSLKDAQVAAAEAAAKFGIESEQFIEASKKAGKLRDEINDIKEATSNFAVGTKFEALNNVLGDTVGKFRALDFKGVGESLKRVSFKDVIGGVKETGSAFAGLGKALLTNPIFLIAAVIIGIGAALYALKDKIKPIGALFDAITYPIKVAIQALKDFSDWLGFSSFAAEESAERIKAAEEKKMVAIERHYDREIALAKAAGKDTFELEQAKLRATIDSNNRRLESLRTLYREQGKLNEEQLKEFEELKTNTLKLQTEFDANIISKQKEADDKAAAARKEAADKAEAARKEALRKKQEELNARLAADKQYNKEVEDLAIKSIQDAETREIAKLDLDKKRKIEEINTSKASQEVKNKALLAVDEAYQIDKKAIEDKYAKEAEDKAKEEREKREKNAQLLKEQIAKIEDEIWLSKQDATTKAIAEAEKELETKLNALHDLSTNEEEYRATKELLEAEHQEKIAKIQDEAREEQKKKDREAFEAKIDQVNQYLAAATSLVSSLGDLSEAQTNRENNANKERLKNNEITQEQFDKKSDEIARKAFNRNKALQIAQAVINGAQAVLQALASSPPPASYALAALAGIAATAQILKIKSTQYQGSGGAGGKESKAPGSTYAKGGILKGPSHAQGGILTPYGELEGEEAIINKNSTQMHKGLLSLINSSGGGVNFAPSEAQALQATPLAPSIVKTYVVASEMTSEQEANKRIEKLARL